MVDSNIAGYYDYMVYRVYTLHGQKWPWLQLDCQFILKVFSELQICALCRSFPLESVLDVRTGITVTGL